MPFLLRPSPQNHPWIFRIELTLDGGPRPPVFFFSMSVQLGLFLIAGDILSMQLSSSWIKFNAKSKSDCEAIISNSRRCYMWRHWLLRKQQLNIQACLFQRKQKTTKWKYILFSLRPLATLQKSQDCFQISAHVSLISEMLVAYHFSKISPELEM